jgi:thiamine-phosphate diphosphorylase / hydroxyethylthiazole kinase
LRKLRRLLQEAQITWGLGLSLRRLRTFSTKTACPSSLLRIKADAQNSKENTKSIIGVDGLQQILNYLSTLKSEAKTVCIGGINASNVSRVVWQSAAPRRTLDGVAVVSAIVAADDPEAASRELLRLIKSPPAFGKNIVKAQHKSRSPEDLLKLVPGILRAVDGKKPLSHNMTNLVVQNIAANVALNIGGSPIMANYGEEAKDLAKLGGALVINMGTVTPDGLDNYLKALKAYNEAGQPVVFDPVGYESDSLFFKEKDIGI